MHTNTEMVTETMAERAYLDWNATAPLRPKAREAMIAILEICGNPSSVHGEGRLARAAVERAREQVAALVGASARDVVFTSGGTEANALALAPSLARRLLISAVEHPSVRAGGRFSADAVREIPVDAEGVVDLAALETLLAAGPAALVSVMLANNETGAVQPIARVAEIVHAAGGLLHVDAVQGPGRIFCDFNVLNADLMTISSHKIGGPQGVGALIRRADLDVAPLAGGGGQERGARPGTENVAGIVGFGAAAESANESGAAEAAHLRALRDRLERGILARAPGAVIFSAGTDRLPNTTLVGLPGTRAETSVIALDLAGIAVSSGAACSSGRVSASHVLAAMGVPPDLARSAIRLSVGYASTERDIDLTLAALESLAESRSESWANVTENLYKGATNPRVFAA